MQHRDAPSGSASCAQSPLHTVHILLYTVSIWSWLDRPDQLRELEEFLNPKRGPASGHDVEGILGDKVSPVRRHGAQTASAVMEPGPVLTPVLTTHDQIEFPAKQRMVRVRHPKRSALNVTMRRS